MSGIALPIVALSGGDPAGIGPEICIKAALSHEVNNICRPLIFGDRRVMDFHRRACKINVPFNGYKSIKKIDWSKPGMNLFELDLFSNDSCVIGEINAANGRAAVDCATAAIAAAIANEVSAVVAAPHTEEAIHLAGIEFDGYPSFLARQTGMNPDDVYLMVCFDHYRIAHVTLHSSVRRSLELITEARVKHIISAVNDTLIQIGIVRPKILVGGLNPHASENGLFGSEEAEIIKPAIAVKRDEGIDVSGPIGSDLMVHQKGYDAFVVMLHDQGHIPAKLLAKHRTAALSIGSPIMFSSVAHGSAHDIAGQGKAGPEAMVEAINLLVQ